MAEFAHSELDLASQPWYLPLVSIGSPLGQWPGSCIFGNREVTSLYMGILALELYHFEPHSYRWTNAGWESLQTITANATAFEFNLRKVLGPIYGGITPVCSLPAFHFTVSDTPTHTPPNQGRVGAMGRHAFGSFSASRRSWWAILRQCTGRCLLVGISHQEYHQTYLWIRLTYLSKISSFSSYSGFCWFLRFGIARRPVLRLLSAIKMLHTRPQPAT